MGVWRFEQVGGERTLLELRDHAAPHGRPRQGSIVDDELEIRESEVYYGGDTPPTRHIWGNKFTPWELKGRWSDGYGGRGFARSKAEEAQAFVNAKQQCLISWDDEVSALGFVRRIRLGREGKGEIAWEMTILIDSNNQLDEVSAAPPEPQPQGLTNRILEAFTDLDTLTDIPPTLTGSIFDSLNGLISSINSVSASLNAAADQLRAIERAPFLALRRLRSGLNQFRTAIVKLRNTYDDLQTNLAIESENADQGQLFWTSQAHWGETMAKAMRDLAKVEKAADKAERGAIRGVFVAQGGDTWESVSVRIYGTAGRAGDIRDANGVQPGQAPVAGTTYLLPR